MRNFKYLCLLFVILTASKIICIPINEEKCSIPPELLMSFDIESTELNDNLKNCRDEQDIKYCQEIRHLATDINKCNLGKLWDTKEFKENRISGQMSIVDEIDICLNFGNLVKTIDLADFGEKSAVIQLIKNSYTCKNFCTRQPKICPLILKLHWIRHVLMDAKNEISKPNKPSKTLTTQKDEKQPSGSVQSLDHGTSPKEIQTQEVSMPAEKLNPDNKVMNALRTDISETVGKVSNTKSHISNENLQNTGTMNEHVSTKHPIPSLTNDADAKLPISKSTNEETTQLERKQSTNQQTKGDKHVANKITNPDSKPKIAANVANKNPVSTGNVDNKNPISTGNVDNKNSISTGNFDNKNTISPDNVDNSVKKEVSKNTDGSLDKKVIKELENKLSPDDKPTVLPTSFKEIPSESENSLNQESEKTDKTEFGNQPNEFNDEIADPANDYPEDNLPPTVNVGKVETKVEVDKKYEISISKDNRVGSGFPEEDGRFFAYFLTIIVLCIAGYLVFHNKQKIIALIIEGRHERRRRPNGGYKRLDSKDSSKSTSQVIF